MRRQIESASEHIQFLESKLDLTRIHRIGRKQSGGDRCAKLAPNKSGEPSWRQLNELPMSVRGRFASELTGIPFPEPLSSLAPDTSAGYLLISCFAWSRSING